MREEILITEDLYASQFSLKFQNEDEITYRDYSIRDMYDHNFTLGLNEAKLAEIIDSKLAEEDNLTNNFFKILTYFPFPEEILTKYPNPRYNHYDYMELPAKLFEQIKINPNCQIIEFNNSYYDECIACCIELNKQYGDFAKRSILSRLPIYKKGKVKLFICLVNGQAIGTCELFIRGNIGKIDNEKVKTVYLVTDSDDTAKEMYQKCGFKKIGDSYTAFFDLKKEK